MKENKSHKLFHVSTATNQDKSNKLSQKLFKINTPKSNQKKPFKNVTLFINKITHMNLPYKNQNINNSNTKNISNSSSSFFKKKVRFKLYKIKQIENKKLITNVKKHNNLKENLKSKKNSKNQKNYLVGRWKLDEHQRFLEAIIKYGNDWKQVQKLVKTRSSTQARSHAQKFFIKLKQSKIMSNINIDISSENISINNLHYYLSNLKKNEYDKVFQELSSIAFDKSKKARSLSKSSYINSGEETTGIINSIDSMDYKNDEFYIFNPNLNKRKGSFDVLLEKKRKKSIESISEFYALNNDFYSNKENKNFNNNNYIIQGYELNEDKNYNENNNLELSFNDLNGKIRSNKSSRKQTLIEDDFIFNNMNLL